MLQLNCSIIGTKIILYAISTTLENKAETMPRMREIKKERMKKKKIKQNIQMLEKYKGDSIKEF